MVQKRERHSAFLWKNTKQTPPRRPRQIWEDNIKKGSVRSILRGDCVIDLVQNLRKWRALAKKAMNHRLS